MYVRTRDDVFSGTVYYSDTWERHHMHTHTYTYYTIRPNALFVATWPSLAFTLINIRRRRRIS